jgi:hypothetical protein
VTHGIDSSCIPPIEAQLLHKILSYISAELKKGRRHMIETLACEINDEYVFSIYKASVEYVLKDPRENPFKQVNFCLHLY